MVSARGVVAAAVAVVASVGASAVLQQLPATMSAVEVTGSCARPNFTNCLSVVQKKTPEALPTQVVVKINSSSVNPSDLDVVIAVGKLFGVPGVDFAGEVVEVGTDCPRLSVGDKVWGWTKGAYADYAWAECGFTSTIPDNVPLPVAGTIPEVGGTSVEALLKCGAPWDVSKNLTVVITSGSGGTGFIGVQLAKAYGAGTIVTAASGADNIALMKQLGADVVIDYKVENIFDALPNGTVDVVYDNYGAKGTADRAMPKMKTGGVFLLLPGGGGGALSKNPKTGVRQINFGDLVPKLSALDTLKEFFNQGKLVPHVQATLPFSRITDAFVTSNSGTVVGKLAIVPDQ